MDETNKTRYRRFIGPPNEEPAFVHIALLFDRRQRILFCERLGCWELANWSSPKATTNGEEIVRTNNRIALLAVIGLAASTSTLADTLPSSAQPISGMIPTGLSPTPFPITIPDGWVFVLTDYESNSNAIIFSAEDLERARWRSLGSYGHSFQTGLVFSSPPLIQY